MMDQNVSKQKLLSSVFNSFNLTSRELEVIEALIEGHTSSRALSEHLKISESTANNHIDNIAKKTNFGGKTNVLSFVCREILRMIENQEIMKITARSLEGIRPDVWIGKREDQNIEIKPQFEPSAISTFPPAP